MEERVMTTARTIGGEKLAGLSEKEVAIRRGDGESNAAGLVVNQLGEELEQGRRDSRRIGPHFSGPHKQWCVLRVSVVTYAHVRMWCMDQ
jgi:hypothetical protein